MDYEPLLQSKTHRSETSKLSKKLSLKCYYWAHGRLRKITRATATARFPDMRGACHDAATLLSRALEHVAIVYTDRVSAGATLQGDKPLHTMRRLRDQFEDEPSNSGAVDGCTVSENLAEESGWTGPWRRDRGRHRLRSST